jgi:ATP synthase protein I
MAKSDDLERLRALDVRIADMKAAQAPPPRKESHHETAHVAWRMVLELVTGLGIGFGMGFGLDYVFGTKPFLLVLFILLGFAAGVRTMMRTAQELQQSEVDKADAAAAAKQGDDNSV